mgnify:CR=1 FL=1
MDTVLPAICSKRAVNNEKDSLISENIGKALLLFVLPLIAGSLIQQLYTTVDAVIVGQFTGKVDLLQLILYIHFLSFRLTL